MCTGAFREERQMHASIFLRQDTSLLLPCFNEPSKDCYTKPFVNASGRGKKTPHQQKAAAAQSSTWCIETEGRLLLLCHFEHQQQPKNVLYIYIYIYIYIYEATELIKNPLSFHALQICS
ncbi:unnamed protein product [Caretta caretta]